MNHSHFLAYCTVFLATFFWSTTHIHAQSDITVKNLDDYHDLLDGGIFEPFYKFSRLFPPCFVWHNLTTCSRCEKRSRLLLEAVKKGNVALVKALLAKQVSFKLVDEQGNNALHLAAIHGKTDIITLLPIYQSHSTWPLFSRPIFADTRGYVPLDMQNNAGDTPLHCAVQHGHMDLVNRLLAHNADHEIVNNNGETPFLSAMREGKKDIALTLLKHDADPGKQNDQGQNALHIAAQNGFHELVEMTSIEKQFINQQDKHGETPLSLATRGEHYTIVQQLVTKGADPLWVDQKTGDTLLHIAISLNNKNLINFFATHTTLVKHINKNNISPLIAAARNNNWDAATILIAAGAPVDIHDPQNRKTILHYAYQAKQYPLIQQALNHKAPLNHQDTAGKTLFDYAVENNDMSFVQQLIPFKPRMAQKGGLCKALEHNNLELALLLISYDPVLVNEKTGTGETPLIHMIRKNNEPAIQFLLAHGARIDTKNNEGNTALHIATSYGNKAMVKLLEAQGAQPVLKTQNNTLVPTTNNKGQTILHMAVASGNIDLITHFATHQPLINAADHAGHTPLTQAICLKHDHAVACLIDHNANVTQLVKTFASVQKEIYNGYTPLLIAISKNMPLSVRKLLDHGARIDDIDPFGNTALHLATCFADSLELIHMIYQPHMLTHKNGKKELPLHIAVMNNKYEIVRFLLDQKTPLDEYTREGHTPLTYAISTQQLSISRILIQAGADIHRPHQKTKQSPFALAIEADSPDFIRLLLDNGINLTQEKINKDPVIHYAIRNNKTTHLSLLVTDKTINTQDQDGNTPLHLALYRTDTQIVKTLLEHRAVNIHITNNDQQTIVHAAVASKKISLLELLLRHMSLFDMLTLIDRYDNGQLTPLHRAIKHNALDMVHLLLEYHADPNKVDTQGNNAVHMAVAAEQYDILRELLINKAPCTSKNNKEETPLLLASKQGKKSIVELLHQSGASLHTTDADGNTLLHWAAYYGHTQLIDYLVTKGININTANKQGNTSLHTAANREQSQAIAQLLDLGADSTRHNNRGSTPLDIAKNLSYSLSRSRIIDLLQEQTQQKQIEEQRLVQLINSVGIIKQTNNSLDTQLKEKAHQGHTHYASSDYYRPCSCSLAQPHAATTQEERKTRIKELLQCQNNEQQEKTRLQQRLQEAQTAEREHAQPAVPVQQPPQQVPHAAQPQQAPQPSAPPANQSQQREAETECCICFEEKPDLRPLPCTNQHPNRVCPACLSKITECPLHCNRNR